MTLSSPAEAKSLIFAQPRAQREDKWKTKQQRTSILAEMSVFSPEKYLSWNGKHVHRDSEVWFAFFIFSFQFARGFSQMTSENLYGTDFFLSKLREKFCKKIKVVKAGFWTNFKKLQNFFPSKNTLSFK